MDGTENFWTGEGDDFTTHNPFFGFNSLTIMQRCDRCEQWNTFRNCNDEIVDFRHRLFLYFAAYLIYLGTTFRDNMTGNNCTFSKQTFL